MGIVLAILGPPAILALGGENHLFATASAIAIATIVNDLPTLTSDVTGGNDVGLATDIGQVAYDVITGLIDNLSWGAMLAFVAAEGFWSVGTLGWGDAADLGAGALSAGIFAVEYVGQFLYGYYV